MKRAFVFPGQGSQSPGMMSGFVDGIDIIRTTFSEASEILGRDLWALVQDGPAEDLNQTVVTQPVMLCAGIATWRVAQKAGVPAPAYLAGHSLGEYSALVAADAISFADAVKVVEYRAQVMQAAVAEGTGAMAAVLGLDDAAVEAVCAEAAGDGVVEAVNFNAPGQVVIAGLKSAVTRACEMARAAGAKRCLELPVSVPSHCALMRDAAELLAERLQETEINAPKIPVVHNVDLSRSADPAAVRAALVSQLHQPVRWAQTIAWLQGEGVTGVVECGPGKVLAGLNRRIDRSLNTVALVDDAAIERILTESGELA